jgi:hypothetical protein
MLSLADVFITYHGEELSYKQLQPRSPRTADSSKHSKVVVMGDSSLESKRNKKKEWQSSMNGVSFSTLSTLPIREL